MKKQSIKDSAVKLGNDDLSKINGGGDVVKNDAPITYPW